MRNAPVKTWKLVAIALLLPLGLSGSMLFMVATRHRAMSAERRLRLGIVGVVLATPSMLLLLLNAPLRRNADQDGETPEGEDEPQP